MHTPSMARFLTFLVLLIEVASSYSVRAEGPTRDEALKLEADNKGHLNISV